VRPQLPVTHNFAFFQHTPSKSLRVEIIHTTNLAPLAYRCTRYRNALLLIMGLLLVPVARLPAFSSLVYFSYALHIQPHSPRWPTSCTLCISGLILLADLHLVGVACLLSLSSLANISYALLLCCHSLRWPTFRTRSSSAVILLTGQHLVHVAHLASFSLQATATTCCSFDLITVDLRSDVC